MNKQTSTEYCTCKDFHSVTTGSKTLLVIGMCVPNAVRKLKITIIITITTTVKIKMILILYNEGKHTFRTSEMRSDIFH